MNENTGKLYGYIRVSTKEQNEDRQRVAMHEFGIVDRDLYMDKQSGKDFERPNYKKLVRKLNRATPLSSRASTGWDATMKKYWSSGASSPEKRKQPSWFWICRCWTPGRGEISPERSSRTLCSSF